MTKDNTTIFSARCMQLSLVISLFFVLASRVSFEFETGALAPPASLLFRQQSFVYFPDTFYKAPRQRHCGRNAVLAMTTCHITTLKVLSTT